MSGDCSSYVFEAKYGGSHDFQINIDKTKIILLLKTTTFRAIIIGMYHHLMVFYQLCSYYGHMTKKLIWRVILFAYDCIGKT